MTKLNKHIDIGFYLTLGLVIIAGLRGMPANATPQFGIPVAIILGILAASIGINYGTIRNLVKEANEKSSSKPDQGRTKVDRL